MVTQPTMKCSDCHISEIPPCMSNKLRHPGWEWEQISSRLQGLPFAIRQQLFQLHCSLTCVERAHPGQRSNRLSSIELPLPGMYTGDEPWFEAAFVIVRQAWRVAREPNQLGRGGHAGELEVKVLYMKTRFRGLAMNTAQLMILFALSNLWMARRHLLTNAGEMHL